MGNVPQVKTAAPTKRSRKIKLGSDAAANVASVGNYRLNQAVSAIQTVGKCNSKSYAWTPEQLQKAQTTLIAAVNAALANLKAGREGTGKAVQQIL